MLDLRRSKWLNKLATQAIQIDNAMKAENRTVPTEKEKDIIRRFMQIDQPYSLMCEIYIRQNLAWAL